jgi:hypothetical protein
MPLNWNQVKSGFVQGEDLQRLPLTDRKASTRWDIERIIAAYSAHGVAVEINANP